MSRGFKNLVVFPFKAELLGVVSFLEAESSGRGRASDKTRSFKGVRVYEFAESETVFGVCGHGKAQSAMICEHLVGQYTDLQVLVCAGSGGALGSELSPGDIVCGDQTVEHDFYEKALGQRGKPQFKSDLPLVERFQKFSTKDFQTKVGTVASGDEDIVGSVRKKTLSAETGALVVGWEGAGVARVARWHELAFCELRAVTDSAEGAVLEEFRQCFPKAMKNLGQILEFMFLTKTTKTE